MVDVKRTLPLTVLALLVTGPACHDPKAPGEGEGESKAMTQQRAADLALIRQSRILFSHHSVGANIIAGIAGLDAEAGNGVLRITSSGDSPVGAPGLIHVSGGRNTDPRSKIDFFAATIRSGPRSQPKLAFMKFCFVDFDPGTDVDDLFSYYRLTLESLKREHPEIRFAHVTVPLFKRPTDIKQSVRRGLGLEVWEDEANVKRSMFNERLIKAFPSDPVFDLARVEAIGPDGQWSTFKHAGRSYPSLHPAYTDDGGHLNALGRRAAGAAAIRFLADGLAGHGEKR